LPGHFIRVQPTGVKAFVAVTRDPQGKQVWTTIGRTTVLKIDEARAQARTIIKRVQAGRASPDSFKAVAESWLRRHVRAKELLTAGEIERCLRKYVYPSWAERDFASIKRSDITKLLDKIEDAHGAGQADAVLAIVRKLTNWHATRHDDYASPVVKGMRRTDPKQRARARILTDDELRAVWKRAEADGGKFGAVVRLLLLTAQRRDKVFSMTWGDISDAGEWTIPAEKRGKGTGGTLKLPPVALEIIHAQPRFASNYYVFAGRAKGHFNGYSKAKAAFDAKLGQISPWILHDLRRTARSLMARAGVRPDIAERVLGHAITGVEGVYDRHSYNAEKAHALAALAALIERIANN
jgi:integrase